MDYDLDELYRILKLTGGKFVIVEDGKPKAVLMDYKEFSELTVPQITEKLLDKARKIEEINARITKAQLEENEADDLIEEVIGDMPGEGGYDDGLTIEPLDEGNLLDRF